MPEEISRLLGPKDLQLNKGGILNAVVVPNKAGSADGGLTNSERLKRKKDRQRKERRGNARRWILGLATAAGLTIGPQLFSQVRNFESNLFNGDTVPASINDPTLKEWFPSILAPVNFEAITPSTESLQAQNQKIDLEKMVGTIGFPIDLDTIKNTPTIRFTGSFGSELPPGVSINTADNVSNSMQITGLPKGTIIYSPVEGGVLSAGTAGVKQDESGKYVPAYTLLSFRFVDKEGNNGIVSLSVLGGKPLIDIPPAPIGPILPTDQAQVKLFQPLLVLDSDALVNDNGNNYAVAGQGGQVSILVIYKRGDQKSLFLQPDFLKQNNKVIVPQGEQK